jgi:hypothetical protein
LKRLFILALALALAPNLMAQSWFVRGLRDLGHQYKATFTDMRPHKGKFGWQWPLMVTVLTAAAATDMATTCRGMILSHGQFYETNPLFFHTRSCAKFTALAVPAHITELAFTHGMTEGMVDICKAQADNPDSFWNKRRDTHPMPISYYDPHGCKVIMWMVPIGQIPFNINSSRYNIGLTEFYEKHPPMKAGKP